MVGAVVVAQYLQIMPVKNTNNLSPETLYFLPLNAPKCVWWPGLQRSPDVLAGLKGRREG